MRYLYVLIFTLSNLFVRSQTFCEGNNNGWNPKAVTLEAFPSYNLSLTTGWVPYPKFTDEFNSFDYNKWEKRGTPFCHSMSPEAYFDSSQNNVKIENGRLKLKAKQENTETQCCLWGDSTKCKDYNFSSGYIASKDTIRYGYIEVKCYLPNNIALKPCFWLTGQKGMTEWPFTNYRYDEIDVFERFNYPHQTNFALMQNIYHNLHDTATTISKLIQTVDFNNAFAGQWAIFAVEWLPEELNFYINGHICKSVKFAEESTGLPKWEKNDFTCINFLNQTDQRIQISLSLDTLVYNNPDLSESFEVEYVRSYKLKKGNDDEYWPLNFSMADTNMFKVHKSIRLGWDGHTANIPIGHNITLWAREGIVLDKGFVVTANTTFVARNIKTTNLFEY